MAFAALALAILFEAAHALFAIGGSSLDSFVEDGLYTAVELAAGALCLLRVVRRREDRLAWLLMAFALMSWTAGDLVWTVWLDGLAHPPSPSIADAFYLITYPLMYTSLTLLIRRQRANAGAGAWLDGIVVGLTTAAIGAALILPAVSNAGASAAATPVAVNLAYPLGDFCLLVFVALGFAVSGWRPGRQWLLLGVGLAVSACADLVFVYQEAIDAYVPGRILDVMWPLSMALLALAAWQPRARRLAREQVPRHTVILPVGFASASLALLVSGSFRPLSASAVALATCAMAAASLRAALTYLQHARMLQRETLNAITDSLTGLGNRRRLIEDLELAVEGERRGRLATLAFFDLDGFKRYNDSFGHGAGDALLVRLGKALARAVEGCGRAYRLGGDEFCVLLDGSYPHEDPLLDRVQAALAERGSGFSITASRGSVVLPVEARAVSVALNLADERMYRAKATAGGSSRARAETLVMQHSVLMQLLAEREPSLREHVSDVGVLAVSIGRALGLDSEELDELGRAAELHDLGKLAVPEEVLNKPGPLSESEWALMRQHTLIGERILSAAPALRPVARLVRSSHERWDGAGYPDGLAGEAIPLGARIIAACDAYDAIVSERPYDGARSAADALEELTRHAGRQFDPRVVELLCEHVRSTRATQAPRENSGQRPGTPLSACRPRSVKLNGPPTTVP